MKQKSVAFRYLDRAIMDARFVSAGDGVAVITECRCYGEPRFYVGTLSMPPSRRHDPAKHRELGRWHNGVKDGAGAAGYGETSHKIGYVYNAKI